MIVPWPSRTPPGFTHAVREFLGADERTVDPRRYLKLARSSVADAVAALCTTIR